MLNLISRGGPVLWALLALSLVSLGIFLERFFHYHRAQIRGEDFLRGIFNILSTGNRLEAVALCDDAPGPIAKVIRAALLAMDGGPEKMRRMMTRTGLQEISRLELRMPMLATAGAIGPLLGLLGSFHGLMRGFELFSARSPNLLLSDLSGPMWSALIHSAFGLGIGIAAYAGYNFLLTRIQSILLGMEQASYEFLDHIESNPVPPAEKPE
jgi:biopolymer transport protein ExbB